MRKKIVALIMVIPLFLMFTMFNAANTYSLLAPVPVGGVRLNFETGGKAVRSEGFALVDLSDPGQTLTLLPEILPANASNRDCYYTQSADGEGEPAQVEIDGEGRVTPRRAGRVKLTVTTNDGGYSDSMILQIVTQKPTALDIFSPTHEIEEGTPASLTLRPSDREFELFLSTDSSTDSGSDYSDLASWFWLDGGAERPLSECPVVGSAGEGETGTFRVLSLGEATLRVSLDGEHTASGGRIYRDIRVVVANDPDRAFALYGAGLEGGDFDSVLSTFGAEAVFSVWLNPEAWANSREEPIAEAGKVLAQSAVYDESRAEVTFSEYDPALSSVRVTVTFPAPGLAEFELVLPALGPEAQVTVSRLGEATERNFFWKKGSTVLGEQVWYSRAKSSGSLTLARDAVVPLAGTPVFDSGDPSVFTVRGSGSTAVLTFHGEGDALLSAEVTVKRSEAEGGNYRVTKKIVVSVVEVPTYAEINERAAGIAGEFVLGGYALTRDGYREERYPLQVSTDARREDLAFSSDNRSAAQVSEEGVLTVTGDGRAVVTVSSKNAALVGTPVRASFTFRCVKDAVNVSTYSELLRASADARYAIVLRNSIGSDGDVLADSSVQPFYTTLAERPEIPGAKWYPYDTAHPERVVCYTSMPATSDLQYNRNLLAGSAPIASKNEVNVGITVTRDLYGNGFFLNAHHLTNCRTDGVGKPILTYVDPDTGRTLPVPFNNAVNFVAITAGFSNSYTVYGQDNIAFLIKGKGIRVDNVKLQGINEGTDDYAKLDYCGTTAEVMGEDVTISNSRLVWGRTVLRIFSGNANDFSDDSETSVLLERCILGYAREFTLRIGANKVKKYAPGTYTGENFGPKLGEYCNPTRFAEAGRESAEAQNDALAADPAFVEDYVRTFVTVRDCVFEKSGLFSIAMDSHFAGELLNTRGDFGWQDCSGTSYAASLTLEGQVRMYDWKDVDTINSNSLVGLNDSSFSDPFGMRSMLGKLDDRYGLLIRRNEEGGVRSYVHGGITFFGGGRNYSLLINRTEPGPYRFPSEGISIGLGEAEISGGIAELTSRLVRCAGEDKFRFYLCTADDGLSLTVQEQDLQSGNNYRWLYES